MANWVTLPNGVHIDLDDPHNPVTGDGDWSDLGGGDKSSGGKGSKFDFSKAATYKAKNEHTIKVEGTYNGLVQYKERGTSGVWQRFHTTPDKLQERLESRGYKSAESTTISSKANGGSKAAPKDSDEFYEWYNSLSKEDRAFIDRSMGADKEEGAKYEKGNPTLSGKDSKSFDRDLERAFKEFDGDEDAILDALRASGKDYGMSNGDLQSVVEAYVLNKGSSKSNDDGPSTFAMAKEMGMKASDLYGVTEKEIRERYKSFKKGKK